MGFRFTSYTAVQYNAALHNRQLIPRVNGVFEYSTFGGDKVGRKAV